MGEIAVISFSRKTNRLGSSFILPTHCIKNQNVHIDCKPHFNRHTDFLFSYALKLLGLIRTITFPLSTA
jgi:hypothetical protein